ncbi:MAG: transcription antitermination factor NusB [Lautropia sp.]|nr:transcription antitermination factor NusB [Lautropia sp.]
MNPSDEAGDADKADKAEKAEKVSHAGDTPGTLPRGQGAGAAGGKAAGPGSKSRAAARPSVRSARRRSRELAMQGLYQWLLSGESGGAVQAHIESSPGFERADRAHFVALLHGVIREAEEINRLILPFLDREVAHLSPVERATMMIGCYELLRHQEIPYRVVINEAVELAKSFGGTDGYKYVNGVLDKLAGSIRATEAAASR